MASNGYNTPSSYNVSGGGYGDDNANGRGSGGNATLRRRHQSNYTDGGGASDAASKKYRQRSVVKKLDFMFPKVDTEYTVQTDRGGIAFVVACVVIAVLCLAEFVSWRAQNSRTVEHVVVDTSLGQRMQVNLNITFPELACVDVHVDIMDVAGDSQLDLDGSYITKTRLHLDGTAITGKQEQDEGNKHRKEQEIKEKPLPDDYCGPCFGAQARDDQCCNTCDELLAAYKTKQWRTEDVLRTSEQCIREGRSSPSLNSKHKSLTLGEGCNLLGHMKLNRVAGNFHIAMGEGVQRNGKHVHIFNPEETPKFNASHIIHHLSFGGHHEEPFGGAAQAEETPLNGVAKIVQEKHGTTGLFQYFIKIVPTTYVTPATSSSWFSSSYSEVRRETNGFFFTERFRPLMKEYIEEVKTKHNKENQDVKDDKVEHQAGHSGRHADHGHHNVKTNSVLPGVFFIYEIYPFAVEVRRNAVPLTHLLIRLMATIGGVFTIVQFVDGLLESGKRKRPSQSQSHR